MQSPSDSQRYRRSRHRRTSFRYFPRSLDVVRVLGIVTTFFWLLDMVYSFFVGFLRPDGLVEMRLPQIARHYFRSRAALCDGFATIYDALQYVWSGSRRFCRRRRSLDRVRDIGTTRHPSDSNGMDIGGGSMVVLPFLCCCSGVGIRRPSGEDRTSPRIASKNPLSPETQQKS